MPDPTIPELAAWCRRKSADLLTGGSTVDGMNLRAIAAALERAERLEAALIEARWRARTYWAPRTRDEREAKARMVAAINAALTPPAEKETDR